LLLLIIASVEEKRKAYYIASVCISSTPPYIVIFLNYFQMANDILLNMHSNIPKVKMMIKKIVSVLANLLLSTNDGVVISALNLYSILPRFLCLK